MVKISKLSHETYHASQPVHLLITPVKFEIPITLSKLAHFPHHLAKNTHHASHEQADHARHTHHASWLSSIGCKTFKQKINALE